jgi:hypothetical protein
VHAILGGDDDGIGKLGPVEHVLPRRKGVGRFDLVVVHASGASVFQRLGDAHNLERVGHLPGVVAVESAAPAVAQDDGRAGARRRAQRGAVGGREHAVFLQGKEFAPRETECKGARRNPGPG